MPSIPHEAMQGGEVEEREVGGWERKKRKGREGDKGVRGEVEAAHSPDPLCTCFYNRL